LREDLREGLRGNQEGDCVGGFGIGNADVPICGGVNGVGALPFLAVPEVLRGPFPVYQYHSVVHSCSSCHPVPFGASCHLRSVGGFSLIPTAPHGDQSVIRPTLLACHFLAFTTARFFVSFALLSVFISASYKLSSSVLALRTP